MAWRTQFTVRDNTDNSEVIKDGAAPPFSTPAALIKEFPLVSFREYFVTCYKNV